MASSSSVNPVIRTGQAFPGFNSGAHICDVLTKPHNEDLKLLVTELFQQVSEANRGGREERYVAKDRRFFDAIAQILTGNEVCAGVAISGPNILIATNVGTHDKRAVHWQLTATIIEKSVQRGALRLGFTCRLSSSSGEEVTKNIGPFEYQFHVQSGKAQLKDLAEMSFLFSIGEFSYLPDDEVGVNLSIYRELDLDLFNFLMQQEKGETFPLQTPVVTCRGSLKRRAAKLFNLLSFIAKPILRKLPYLPEHCKAACRHYSTFIESEYQGYKQSSQSLNEEEFIQIVRSKCHQDFSLDQGGDTTEDFLQAAREHYQAADLKDRTAHILEKHKQWPNILNDTLTYELSKSLFVNEISLDSKPPRGTRELDQLYRELIQDYKKYKSSHQVQSSIPSIIAWLDSLKENHSLNLPDFVADRFSDFYAITRRYFIQLTVVEEYIKENAEFNGTLAQRVAQESIFEEPGVKIMQGIEGVHTEMRLFNYHLLERGSPADYYGIAKLCCALCHYTFNQFRTAGLHPPETRGTHAGLFRWPLPEALYHEPHMKVFLGDRLFEKYVTLNQRRRLESAKKGPCYNVQDVTRSIISGLDGINSVRNLDKLGIDQRFQIPGSDDHYADNQIPPSLPPSHQNAGMEEKLEKLEEAYHPTGNPSIFDPLEILGRAWREQKNNPYSYYYLTRAVQIFDKFPSFIDSLRAAEVFNTLGNVCRGLKFYDKADKYLLKALQMKDEAQASPYQIAVTLNSLGCLHTDRESLFEANKFFTNALKQAELAGEEGRTLAALIQRNLKRLDESWKS